jgi:uncharacterized SAM-binding protein YcdF (DUF218 family)
LLLGLAIVGGLVAAGLASSVSFDTAFGWLVLLSLPFVCLGCGLIAIVLYSWLYQLGVRHSRRTPSAIIVLGAGLIRGQVPPLLAGRLDRAMEARKKFAERVGEGGAAPLLLVSGGKGRDESRSEAEAMAEYLHVRHGVPLGEVMVEDRSVNTRENIRFSKALLEREGVVPTRDRPVLAVTSNFHAFRAATLMRRERLLGQALGARTAGYYWPSASLREYMAILRDNLGLSLGVVVLCLLPLVYELYRLAVR